MKRIAIFCFFMLAMVTAKAAETGVLSKAKYNEIRNEILDNYTHRPLQGVEKIRFYLTKYQQQLTLRQTLRLRYTLVFFLVSASQFEIAFTELAQCKKLADKLNEPMLTAYYYSYLAGMLEKLENFDLSLETYIEGLKVASKANDSKMIARMNNNIGHVLIELGKVEAAKPYINQFLDFGQKINHYSYISTGFNNLGEIELKLGNLEQAKGYFLKSLELRETHGERLNSAWSYYNLAKLALLSGELSIAVSHLEQAISIFNDYDRDIESLAPKMTLADTLFKLKEFDKAKALTLSTIDRAKKFEKYQILSKAYLLLKTYYFKNENYQQSSLMADEYIKNKEIFMHKQANQALMHYIAKIDLTSKELQNSELRKQNLVANQDAQAKEYQLYLVLTFSVLIILLVYIFMRFLTRKNKVLKKTIAKLNKTQTELIEAEKISAITTLVSGMAHQLNTPLGIIVTAISALKERLQVIDIKLNEKSLNLSTMESFISDAKSSIALSEASSDKASQLIQQFKLISAELKDVKSSSISLKPFLFEKSNLIGGYFEKKLTLNVVGDDVIIETYPDVILEVLEQLLKNSSEHQQDNAESLICSFEIRSLKDTVDIIYQDNGVGISEEDRQQVFNPFFTTKKMSSCLGLGLNIAHNSVTQLLNGKLLCEPCEQGAKFIIHLPLSIKS
ncbi:tetratricopeptide repeat-containing sensor histidine kinase [Thalassotalea sp. 1_MG-2023]|uniref:tetratricopeptide repeat-containing sensor histidine kinase n=1 Tax=Thalassotalea sp. 1_MG-2023 TaxID=3062680 RepID=UPI0026E2F27D|nr:tetratricopeptide repeat-containing sensor histidine kinase [Thalassotalea sp. 1_MG-2023]MDO6427320.1 tetratricopeptide repeat-containing sensor histidine kinase [Thalassotalea sp. 1_MG-2023]